MLNGVSKRLMSFSKSHPVPKARIVAIAPEYLEAYADADAREGCPNPRFKSSSIYCSRYLAVTG